MFDMPHNAGDNEGYQLRITYSTKTKEYRLTSYIIFPPDDRFGLREYDRDGRAMTFNSLEEVLEWILNYKTKDFNQLELPFDEVK